MRQIIVNDKDEEIGVKDKSEITKEDIYRVSALWITNSEGQVLLAKRANTKENDPGRWGPAVAGTVEEGESYESNIINEAEEEIGVKDMRFKKGPKQRITGLHNFFCQWYFLSLDQLAKDFVIQHDEVEKVRWFTKDEIISELNESPGRFLVSMPQIVKELL